MSVYRYMCTCVLKSEENFVHCFSDVDCLSFETGSLAGLNLPIAKLAGQTATAPSVPTSAVLGLHRHHHTYFFPWVLVALFSNGLSFKLQLS